MDRAHAPAPKTEAAAPGILALLSPERRQAVIDEALGLIARSLVDAQRTGTFGALVKALVGNPYWEHLQNTPIATALGAQGQPPIAKPPIAKPPIAKPPIVQQSMPLQSGPAPQHTPDLAGKARIAPPRLVPDLIKKGPAQPVKLAKPAQSAKPVKTAKAVQSSKLAPPVAPKTSAPVFSLATQAMATLLGESDAKPLEELQTVIETYGLEVARAAYSKAIEIEAGEGLVREGRRKTLGGVFFYLAKTPTGQAMLGPELAQRARDAKRYYDEHPPAPPPPPKAFDLVSALIAFIAAHPGLRRDEIQTHFGGDRLVVRAALDALSAQKKVRQSGSGRMATYSSIG